MRLAGPAVPAPAAGAAAFLGLAALLVLGGLLGAAAPAEAKTSIAATDTDFTRNRFEPAERTVAPFEPVVVRNTGKDQHTLTPVQAGAWPEVVVAPGEFREFNAPTEPGDYRFYCRFHASPQADAAAGAMAGVLRVRPGQPAGDDPARRAPGPEALGLLGALALAGLAARPPREPGDRPPRGQPAPTTPK